MNNIPEIGTWVKLIKGRTKKSAQVIQHYKDIKGGVRLDRRLDDFASWNMADLEPASPNPRPAERD